jgi:SMI1-KNR4 cell-wall
MTLDDFRKTHQRYQKEKPKLFLLAEPDPCATVEQLNGAERQIAIELPPSYRSFLMEFGGGVFGFTNVFSADPTSDYYLPVRKQEASAYLPTNLLPFSDDSAGGLYVLKVANGRAMEPVSYWNSDGGLVATAFANILDFVARYAYEPA